MHPKTFFQNDIPWADTSKHNMTICLKQIVKTKENVPGPGSLALLFLNEDDFNEM